MSVAIEEVGRNDVSCFGHTLQMAINRGLSDIVPTAAAQKLVEHFKQQ